MRISPNAACVILVTTPSTEEGEKLARGLVRRKLAACVNMISGVKSLYRWENKMEESGETLLIIKTMKKKAKDLEVWVKANHSYTVPEIIALPILEGNPAYLRWLEESTRS